MSSSKQRWLGWLIAVVALVGLFDASYLTAEHYLGVVPTCFVATGCDTVLTSQYAQVAGVPISLFGVAYYLVVLLLAIRLTSNPSQQYRRLLVVLTTVGFLASLWLVYIQLGILKAICAYCMVSAGTSTVLWVSSLALARTKE